VQFKFDKLSDSTLTLAFSGELSELGGVLEDSRYLARRMPCPNDEKMSVVHRELSKREPFSDC